MKLVYMALKTRMSSSLINHPSFPASVLGVMPDRIHITRIESLVYSTEVVSFVENDESSHSMTVFFDFKSLCGYSLVGHNMGLVGSWISIEKIIDSPETDTSIYCVGCLKNASFLIGVEENADSGNRNEDNNV